MNDSVARSPTLAVLLCTSYVRSWSVPRAVQIHVSTDDVQSDRVLEKAGFLRIGEELKDADVT